MSINTIKNDDEFIEHVRNRVNAGKASTEIARELGISRQTLESRLIKSGWRVGRMLMPIRHTTEAAQ